MATAREPTVSWPAMPARDLRLMIAAAVASSALLLAAAVAGHPDLLVFGAPLFLVAVPLLAGRYVGEDRLERLRARVAPERRRRVPAAAAPTRPRFDALVPRGGRLMATALAVRPPPALPAS